MPPEALRRTSFSPAMAISSFGLLTVPPIMINGDILGLVNLATSLALSSAYKNIIYNLLRQKGTLIAQRNEKYSETAQTGDISVAEETALLGEDGTGDDGDAGSPEITMQGLAKMMNSMNENMAAVASSFALLGSSLKRSRDESNSSSRTKKKQKTSNDPTIDDDQHTGDESDQSSHSDSAQLRAIMAPKDETTTSTVEPLNLLSQIASDFDEDENTSGAVTKKLAEIVNKRFSAPLGEEKLKEKLGQYLRPDNCGKLAVPKVTPEIWMKLNRPASRQDLNMASIQRAIVKAGTALTQLAEILLTTPSGTTGPDLGKLLTMNADAVALLGHATHLFTTGPSYRVPVW
ncbi:Hypothetical predicted protein [Paramuricea clavata]|uniref:Uncharacterized protein n=1 Tax=Paramuricea clavata TaxID=317549 RepID=A0A7D9HLH5_PARCT|nr:Hypothetical predicted protein [Paramuricea clavata]